MNKIYTRISTTSQESVRQDYLLEQKGYNKENSVFYEEIYTGKSKNRPILNQMLDELNKGDTIVVTDLTRLARSVKDLWWIGDKITSKGCNLISLKENVDLETSTGKLLFTVIGAIGQFEADTLSDRTKEALRAKKENGQILGRPITLDESNLENAINEYMNSKSSMKVIANKYNISDASLCNSLKKKGLKRENKLKKDLYTDKEFERYLDSDGDYRL